MNHTQDITIAPASRPLALARRAAFVTLFPVLLARCVISGAEAPDGESIGAARASDSSAVSLDFGGMWGTVNGQQVGNPAAGGQAGCPNSSYTAFNVLGEYNVDWPLWLCYRASPDGGTPDLDFGGMWGYVNGKLVNNPITQSSNCPFGYTDEHVLGTPNVDYDLHYCYRTHTATEYKFGGMFGFVNGSAVANPGTFPEISGCPDGYVTTQVLGTTNVDWPLSFCYQPPPQVPLDFGGMFGYAGEPVLNPATESSACPSGYNATLVYGTLNTDYPLTYCWRRSDGVNPPALDFGGMYSKGPSAATNPVTSADSCPADYSDLMVLGTYNVDNELHYCYRTHESGTPAALFGGMFGYTNGVAINNVVTGSSSPPDGYTKVEVLNAYNVDWPLYYYYKVP